MKQLDAPYLELNFYFTHLPELDAFASLIKALVSLGAQFTGEGLAHQGASIRNRPFASITEEIPKPVTVSNITDLTRHLDDPDTRLVQVYMNNATGTVHNDVAEIITYVSISAEAAHLDRHPLATWTEGWLFSGPPSFRKQYLEQARKVGEQIYHQFKALVDILQPAYAAITNDYALECPTDLQHNPNSYAFRDFFISRAYLGTQKLVQIQNLFSSAYIEPVGEGIYISSTKEMNPEGKELDIEYTLKQSNEITKLIVSASKLTL